MNQKAIATHQTRNNLWVDLAIFAACLLALSPNLTGLRIHEWLSLALAATVMLHLLLHWAWLEAVLRRFFGRLTGTARFNLILNAGLFVDFTVVMFTGLMISRVALPGLGIEVAGGRAWRGLHTASADLLLLLVGLHVAVHWKWILTAARRYLLNPLLALGRPAVAPPVSPEAQI